MKLISLNVAGGRWLQQLLAFLRQQNEQIDIFCFQEVISQYGYEGIPEAAHRLVPEHLDEQVCSGDIAKALEHKLVYLSPHCDVERHAPSGNAIYANTPSGFDGLKNFDFKTFDLFSYEKKGKNVSLQTLAFEFYDDQKPGKTKTKLCVMNIHGVHVEQGKIDTPERIRQMEKIRDIVSFLNRRYENPDMILCGDFNLNPNTFCIDMIEDMGFRNLITEFGITNTRSSLYSKKERYADYIFVSNGILVNSFNVLDVEISDHLPLMLDFDLVK